TAAAEGVNPFVDGQIPNHNTPNIGAPNPNQGDNNQFGNPHGNQFGNQFGNQHGQVDDMNARLTRYLVGKWQGAMNNGQRLDIVFLQDGRFVIVNPGAQIALVGRFTVAGGQISFSVAARCSLATRQCENLPQVQTTTIAFRPVDGQTFSVADGTL